MDPLEARLASELHATRPDLPLDSDPLPRVLAGVRRRRRRRVAATLGSGLATVAVVVTAVGLVGSGTHHSAPVALVPTPHATAATSAPPATSPSVPTNGPAPTSGPSVPRGFTASDLTFVSAGPGWALGTAPCRREPCTSLLRTADGGRTWTGGAAPVALLADPGSACGSEPCVSSVRFADPTHGYAFGNGPLVVTSDGGRHWATQPGPATTSLEPSGTDVLRVVTTQQGCPPGCTYNVQRSDIGGAWTTVASPPLIGVRTLLLRGGDDAYVMAFGNPAGGAGTAQAKVIASRDRGRTWAALADPCSPPSQDSPTESDAESAAIGPDGSLAVLCQARLTQGPVTVQVSHDRGQTFDAAGTLPSGVQGQQITVSASGLVAEVSIGSHQKLLRSTNGGRSWTTVAPATGQAEPRASNGYLSFSDGRLGRWLPLGSPTLWTTTDGGATWSTSSFVR